MIIPPKKIYYLPISVCVYSYFYLAIIPRNYLVEVVSSIMSGSGGRHGKDVMADVKVDFIAYIWRECRNSDKYVSVRI